MAADDGVLRLLRVPAFKSRQICFARRVLSGFRSFARYWLPVVLLAGLIFAASSDAGSAQRTSRIIGPLLRWLVPGISDDAVGAIQLVVRKCAHGAEYGLLAGLVWRALYRPQPGNRRPWSGPQALQAWGAATAYAVSDEFHQTFVPSREGSPWDVLVDSTGAALSLWLIHFVGRRLRWWG